MVRGNTPLPSDEGAEESCQHKVRFLQVDLQPRLVMAHGSCGPIVIRMAEFMIEDTLAGYPVFLIVCVHVDGHDDLGSTPLATVAESRVASAWLVTREDHVGDAVLL